MVHANYQNGIIIDSSLSVEERIFNLLESSGLNWSVSKEPLFTASGVTTESFGIIRHDPLDEVEGRSGTWLGTAGNRYEPFQNSDLVDTIVRAADGLDMPVARGGLIAGGKKVFVQVSLPDEFIGNSGVKRYITATNSHDGSTSIGFGSSNTVVVCQNTFMRAYKESAKIRHTTSAKERIDEAMKDLRRAIELDEKLMGTFKRMADIPSTDEMVERVVRKLFRMEDKRDKEASSRRKNQVTAFADSVKKEFTLEGPSLWGLFNGITRYTNHVAAPAGDEKKNGYLMFGGGYQLSNVGFDEILRIVEENTAQPVFVM